MQTIHSSSPAARAGFTLIELLTVIAIVGVLVGILIPVVGHARSLGHTNRCAANMRQIGLQLISYANDNRGVTIPAIRTKPDGTSETWQTILAVHDGNYKHLTQGGAPGAEADYAIWRCPENRLQERIVSGAGVGEAHNSYGINGWSASDQGSRYTDTRVASIASPAQLYMLTEAITYRIEEHKNGGLGTVPAGLYSTGPDNLRYAHRGKINMVFADGHLSLLSGPLQNRGTTVNAGATPAARYSNGVHWYSR